MHTFSSVDQYLAVVLGKNRKWFFIWGIVLTLLGVVAISAATVTTLVSVVFLGGLLLVGGVVLIVDACALWWGRWHNFLILLVLGVLYFAAGLLMVSNPAAVSVSLTLLLGVFYLLAGMFRTIYSLSVRVPGWRWSLTNGIISLIFGGLILCSLPQSGLFIIGLIVGIDLLFTGWTYIMVALAAKKLN